MENIFLSPRHQIAHTCPLSHRKGKTYLRAGEISTFIAHFIYYYDFKEFFSRRFPSLRRVLLYIIIFHIVL